MKQTVNFNFSIGNKFEHYNGYIWEITSIVGKTIKLESHNQTDNSIVKGSMTAKDLQAIISLGYYKPLSDK